jgi:hypothetical protein
LNDALSEFEKSLKLFERDSTEAFALVIFINGCYDTKSFASNKYSALVHYPKAREAANFLESLRDKDMIYFNRVIESAHRILLGSNIIHPDLVLGS